MRIEMGFSQAGDMSLSLERSSYEFHPTRRNYPPAILKYMPLTSNNLLSMIKKVPPDFLLSNNMDLPQDLKLISLSINCLCIALKKKSRKNQENFQLSY